jgi:pimeloyl-ACP methyl ester carboxylesterase
MTHPRLFRIRRGTGEPILLIMGMAGHHRMWGEPFLAALEPAFDIVAFDHRGIGTSDRADAPFTVPDLADDAARVLDEVGWPSAHILGISLGGMVAQELVLRHPSRVRTLTLGCTYPGRGGDLTAPGPQRAIEAGLVGDRELAIRTSFEVNVSRAFAGVDEHYEVFRAAALSTRVPVPVILMQSQAAIAHDALQRLSGITSPTLVIHGTEDEMILPMNAELIAKAIPGARLELFEGVGHLFWWEQPERTVALLREHAGV